MFERLQRGHQNYNPNNLNGPAKDRSKNFAGKNEPASYPEREHARGRYDPATGKYTVMEGDTLYSIAQRFITTVEAIKHLNGADTPKMDAGTQLKIKPGLHVDETKKETTTEHKHTEAPAKDEKPHNDPQSLLHSHLEENNARFAVADHTRVVKPNLEQKEMSKGLVESAKQNKGNNQGPLKDPFNGQATISSGFYRNDGTRHGAYDFAVNTGTQVAASARGTVVTTNTTSQSNSTLNYGNYVLINHGVISSGTDSGKTLYSLYGHLSSISVVVGNTVQAGDRLGLSGNTGHSTGPHLHWELFTSTTNSDNVSSADGNYPNISKTLVDPANFLQKINSLSH